MPNSKEEPPCELHGLIEESENDMDIWRKRLREGAMDVDVSAARIHDGISDVDGYGLCQA
jgi:hypothetical protein